VRQRSVSNLDVGFRQLVYISTFQGFVNHGRKVFTLNEI